LFFSSVHLFSKPGGFPKQRLEPETRSRRRLNSLGSVGMQSQMNSPATSPTGSPARSPRTSLLMRKADEAKHVSGGGGGYGDPAGDNVGESFDVDGVGRGVMSVAPLNAEIQAVVQAGRNGGGGGGSDGGGYIVGGGGGGNTVDGGKSGGGDADNGSTPEEGMQLPPVKARGKAGARVRVANSGSSAVGGGQGDLGFEGLPLWAGPTRPVSTLNVWGKEVLGDLAGVGQKPSNAEPGSFRWQAAQLGLWQ
jgi:hypothetical protein